MGCGLVRMLSGARTRSSLLLVELRMRGLHVCQDEITAGRLDPPVHRGLCVLPSMLFLCFMHDGLHKSRTLASKVWNRWEPLPGRCRPLLLLPALCGK